jgi:hypothetical protein
MSPHVGPGTPIIALGDKEAGKSSRALSLAQYAGH